jgi:hypothetical protein
VSTRRLAVITTIPLPIKKAFCLANPPSSNEERLWRERAARMTLDALGHTSMTVKPRDHNDAVRYARRWFRGLLPDDDPAATFDSAGIVFRDIKITILGTKPILFDPGEDDEDNDLFIDDG